MKPKSTETRQEYKIKQKVEDFIVEELSDIHLSSCNEKKGYCYFVMQKKEYTTLKACEKIAKFLRISLNEVGFAGNKDKQAITKQMISIKKAPTEYLLKSIEAFNHNEITLKFFGAGNSPISLGDLNGNHFDIVIRNLGDEQKPKNIGYFINYFGEQRFGKNNVEIGKCLIKKKYREAIKLIYNPEAAKHLEENPDNPVQALKKIQKRLLMLYVNSYQSYIFNKTIEGFLKDKNEDNMKKICKMKAPIIGFGVEYNNENNDQNTNEELKKISKKILKDENLNERDFIIRELPDISSEGRDRNIFAEIKNLVISPFEDDELNSTENSKKKKCRIIFDLDKSCYATEAIKQMMK